MLLALCRCRRIPHAESTQLQHIIQKCPALALRRAADARWRWTLQRRCTSCTPACRSCTATSRQREWPAGSSGSHDAAPLPSTCFAALQSPPCIVPLHTSFTLFVACSNVLLSGELRAYVADLGLAQLLEGRAHTLRGGSLVYAGGCAAHAGWSLECRYQLWCGLGLPYTGMHESSTEAARFPAAAPEQLMYERCTVAVDMYSFAVLLSELTTRQLATKRGEWRLPRVPDECPQAVVQLIQDCMAFDPVLRPTAAEALQRLQAAG